MVLVDRSFDHAHHGYAICDQTERAWIGACATRTREWSGRRCGHTPVGRLHTPPDNHCTPSFRRAMRVHSSIARVHDHTDASERDDHTRRYVRYMSMQVWGKTNLSRLGFPPLPASSWTKLYCRCRDVRIVFTPITSTIGSFAIRRVQCVVAISCKTDAHWGWLCRERFVILKKEILDDG
jgi:hypothetical protein